MRRVAQALLMVALFCLGGCDSTTTSDNDPERHAQERRPAAPDAYVGGGDYRSLKGR